MVHISTLGARCGAALPSEFPFQGDEINERATGSELNEANLVLAPLNIAPQNIAIEMEHCLFVDNPKNQVINFTNGDHRVTLWLNVNRPKYCGDVMDASPYRTGSGALQKGVPA